MSVNYSVSCRTCQITRDLDRCYSLRNAETRADVLEIAEEIKKHDNFRVAMLTEFMWRHKGHNCTVFCEDDPLEDQLDPMDNPDFKEDNAFWRTEIELADNELIIPRDEAREHPEVADAICRLKQHIAHDYTFETTRRIEKALT